MSEPVADKPASIIKLAIAQSDQQWSKELAHELLDCFGGIRGVAKNIARDYKQSKKGSMIRRCIMNDLMQLLKATQAKTGEDVDGATTEELEQERDELLQMFKGA